MFAAIIFTLGHKMSNLWFLRKTIIYYLEYSLLCLWFCWSSCLFYAKNYLYLQNWNPIFFIHSVLDLLLDRKFSFLSRLNAIGGKKYAEIEKDFLLLCIKGLLINQIESSNYFENAWKHRLQFNLFYNVTQPFIWFFLRISL